MPRPSNKKELLETIDVEYQKLEVLLKTLTEDQMVQPGVCSVWSVKDILAHVHEWAQMVISWYHGGKAGQEVKTPASDLKWSEIPTLNQRIYAQYRDVPLNQIQAKFAASHAEMVTLIASMTEDELVTPKVYSWTKSTALISYFVSSTSSHYHWAYKEIRSWLKTTAKRS